MRGDVYTRPNSNVHISNSIETATQIHTRLEMAKEAGMSADAAYKQVRPLVQDFVNATDDVAETFAFAKYQATVVRDLVVIIDELKPKAQNKG